MTQATQKEKRQSTPRTEAFRILVRFDNPKKGHGNKKTKKTWKTEVLLHDALSSGAGKSWQSNDRALLTALTYGVLRQWLVLESIISQLSRMPWKKIQPKVKTLLRLGLFQLRFMDQIPAYAAVNSTVELAKIEKLSPKTVAFINGILREYQRREDKGKIQRPSWQCESGKEQEQYLRDCGGLPVWFSKRLLAQFSADDVKAMAELINTPPPLTLRVNTLKGSIESYKALLTEAEIGFKCPDETLPEILLLEGFYGSPMTLPGYAEGLFYVQDLSSALLCQAVAPESGETVVDLCAAPGSKTTHMAARMEDKGSLWAVEPVAERLAVLKQNIERLGIRSVKAVLSDAEKFKLPEGVQADRVLVDAPCSGLGTVRKHPEILLQLAESDLESFPELQGRLLAVGADLLKSGGTLVYSTCSLDESENQGVVQAFLETHTNMSLSSETQRLITEEGDGFYWAVLKKNLKLFSKQPSPK